MTTKNAADIIFVVDASDSMSPCIEGLRTHLTTFLEVFRGNANVQWNVRFDFVAHRSRGTVQVIESALTDDLHGTFYTGGAGEFFTTDVLAVTQALSRVETSGNERSLIALDFALDAPWRDSRTARRVIIFLTDEPHETSAAPEHDRTLIPALIEKIHALKVTLFMVNPDSADYEHLASADKVNVQKVTGGDGLRSVDLRRVLQAIAKSISVDQSTLGTVRTTTRGLFGQATWGTADLGDASDR